jgi:arylformamidase
MGIIDISLSIKEGMITYPGNPSVTIEQIKDPASTHSKVTLGSHTGTHIDAPLHVFEKGKGIGELSLPLFFGECRVLDMTHVSEVITRSDLEKNTIQAGERILVKTKNSQRGFEAFYEDYVYLDGDGADFLTQKGILLFGIDSLSIKKKGDPDRRPHTSLLKRDIPILEGITLANVQPGNYTLIALPLKFGTIDASPVRAVLFTN